MPDLTSFTVQVDEATRRRLLKNRRSAERSRLRKQQEQEGVAERLRTCIDAHRNLKEENHMLRSMLSQYQDVLRRLADPSAQPAPPCPDPNIHADPRTIAVPAIPMPSFHEGFVACGGHYPSNTPASNVALAPTSSPDHLSLTTQF